VGGDTVRARECREHGHSKTMVCAVCGVRARPSTITTGLE
jgi:hypothetical protein